MFNKRDKTVITHRVTLVRLLLLVVSLLALGSSSLLAAPLFDTHLHYNERDTKAFSPQQILSLLEKNEIQHAVVTSHPAELATQLFEQARSHSSVNILPLLGVYRTTEAKQHWHQQSDLPTWVESRLKAGHWQGIGELHLFAKDRHSPVFLKIVELAQRYRLPLMLHADPAVIDTVYEQAPDQPVIWAHAGTFPYPDLIADYLERYPALRVDLSVRDGRIAPDGVLSDKWYNLFLSYPDRFMVGVDTFSLSRWYHFDQAVSTIRHWLQQLPEDVAEKLRYGNAARLFDIKNPK